MKNWKNEQLNYFKSYMKCFKKNTREYKLLKESIDQLEGHV
jgi:hypothetical protein